MKCNKHPALVRPPEFHCKQSRVKFFTEHQGDKSVEIIDDTIIDLLLLIIANIILVYIQILVFELVVFLPFNSTHVQSYLYI